MDSFKSFFRKNKASLIVFFIIWAFAEIFFISALSLTVKNSTINGALNLEYFGEQIVPNISSFKSFFSLAGAGAFGVFLKHTFIFTVLYFCFIGIGMWKSRKKGAYDKIEHGSSDWNIPGEQYKILSKDKGIILAEKNCLPLDKSGNTNVLIVGGSGSGKSASYSIPNAHQLLGSYVFTDPKGEIYDKTAGYLKSQGYEIKLLNLVNPESSDSYNPLMHVQSQLDVDIIASTIVRGQKRESTGSDPYWDNMSELLLKSLIYYLLATRPEEEQNLVSCAELVRAASNNGESSLLSDLINKLPMDHPARTNFKNVELASDKTYASILSSLQSSLGKFDSKEIADLTSTNTINFEEIATKKTALYVVSSDTHTAYDFLLTIFFSQMIQQLYDFADRNGGKLPVRTFFILDEFANIGQIPDFDKKISTSRSRGISFSVILQNLDQLKAIYEKSFETIIGNCDTHVFLGSNSTATVEYFSKALGEKTISHESKSVNRNNHAVRQGYSETKQIMARALMTPDELRRLDNQQCIIFEKGLKPIKAAKFWWFKKKNIVEDLTSNGISHNDYKNNLRGEWRKFNPYNPYVEKKEVDKELDIGSLDDLFDDVDDTSAKTNTNTNIEVDNNTIENKQRNDTQVSNMNNNVQSQMNFQPIEEKKNAQQLPNQQVANAFNTANVSNAVNAVNTVNANNNSTNYQKIAQNRNMSARDIKNQMDLNYDESQYNANNFYRTARPQDDEIDIEKELEAKFDELFGDDA